MNRAQAFSRGPRSRFTVVDMPKDKHLQRKTIKRIWQYVKQYPWTLVIVGFVILFQAAFNLVLPYIVQIAIDDYINIATVDFMAVVFIFASVAVLTAFTAFGAWVQRILIASAAGKITKKIRIDAFGKLQKLSIEYYDKNAHGDIMSVITNDVETIFIAFSQVVPQLINAVIMIIGSITIMFFTSWHLTLIVISLFPFMLLLVAFITTRAFKHFKMQHAKLGEVNGIVKEDIDGLKVVKLYNQEQTMIDKFSASNDQLQVASFKAQIYSGMMMPIIRLLDNILYGLVVAVGAVLNIKLGVISVGKIQSMTNYSKMFVRPISNIAQTYNMLQSAVAGGYRVFRLIDEPDEYVNDATTSLPQDCFNVRFENVNFGYDPNQKVLNDINFEIASGKTIAIVGPTGGGKTTIINLLSRFYDPDSGNIYIGGNNVKDFSKPSVRSQMGVVLQTTYLFKGTILDNIKYGNKDATFEEVEEAARTAQVHDIIERLPRKYQTKVKEGGRNFSHGERQLIAIARAILGNPSIIVLDEATSSVDTRTESKIQKSIGFLVKKRTSFIIAHRLQTIKNADLILVVQEGKITEQGSHKELIEKQGLYYEMYSLQFGEVGKES
ncbi:MAG: ABC transporter ATP-binding protein [Bacilli bacterium]